MLNLKLQNVTPQLNEFNEAASNIEYAVCGYFNITSPI